MTDDKHEGLQLVPEVILKRKHDMDGSPAISRGGAVSRASIRAVSMIGANVSALSCRKARMAARVRGPMMPSAVPTS